MSQYRDHFQKTSPASYSGGGESSTPRSHLPALSPGGMSVKSTGHITHTPDRGDKEALSFSPTAQSSGGFRTTGVPVDSDPFVSPTKPMNKGKQPLSAKATAFRPYYHVPPEDTREKPNENPDVQACSIPDQVSPALSRELELTRCLEIYSPSRSILVSDIEDYLKNLASLGSPCMGTKQIFIKDSKAYVRFTNIRDACISHRNIQLCGPDWIVSFMTPPDFVQTVCPADIGSMNEGQLDLLAVLLHSAPMDVSQVDSVVFKLLLDEGDLFSFKKHPRSEEGALKAIIEYADTNTAITVAAKLNGLMVNGLHIRLDVPRDAQPGRAVGLNDGMTTPMATPMRPPHDEMGGGAGPSGHMIPYSKPQAPSQGSLVPFRPQSTPPSSGYGRAPQVALVPMVVRNPYTPGAPLILDPCGPHGPNMGGGPYMLPPGAPVHAVMGSQGFEIGRGFNRRGNYRYDRPNQFNQNGRHNQVDINRIRDGVDVRTTIMLRNIPNKVDQRMLKAMIDESSWGKYDFMYLRIDFANDCNVGYAFINFADPLDIIAFATARDNQRWNCFRSDKVAEISYATIQGRDCLVQKFRNSSVMLEAPHYRPKLYYTVSSANPELAGTEEEFPGPDNPSKMKRSCENAEHVGLFTPQASQYYREEQRRRRSQYDRGTRMAALEEYDYENTLQRMYIQQ